MYSVNLFLFVFTFSKQVHQSKQEIIEHVPDPANPIYMQQTGKTYYQLIKSHQYIPKSAFGSIWDTKDPTWRNFESSPIPQIEKRVLTNNVGFSLYTKSHPAEFKMGRDVQAIKKSGWNSQKDVKILIHGYNNDGYSDLMPISVKNAYLNAGLDHNIICIDWGRLAGGLYFLAADATISVGETISDYVEFLKDNNLIKSYDSVHVVGFSLGSHVAGNIGMYLKEKGHTIARITGLDPAGPSFGVSATRLDSSDAKFIDVIHTNGGDINPFVGGVSLGTLLVSGHADFYPNGGMHQPGCSTPFIGELIGSCSHARAVEFFVQSITNRNMFKSCKCESYTDFVRNRCSCGTQHIMGEYCSIETTGLHYLST